MQSYTAMRNLFATLTQNNTTANLSLFDSLMNIEHRYLLQKYFSNEGSFSVATVGATSLTLTAAPAINAVSATLLVAWNFPTCKTTVTFSDSEVREVTFTNGSTAITWQVPLTGSRFNTTAVLASGDTSATLSTAWATATQSSTSAFSDGSTKTITYTLNSTTISWSGGLSEAQLAYVNTSVMTTTISVGGVQFYRLPPNYSKLKDVTITVGNLKWTLKEVNSREEWDKLNVFPYYADIPANYFIFPGGDRSGLLGIWPIPSTSGNNITFNYKFRVPDLSIADYTTPGTVSVANGSQTVTGSGTSWTATTNAGLESRWIQFAPTSSATTSGDNLWYQIASVDSATSLTLFQPYQGTTITATPAASYTIGQMPLLAEDFQDMLLWKVLVHYFSSIVDNPKKREEFQETYNSKLALLSEYSGSNTIQVNLSPRGMGRNPNLYPYQLTG